MFVNAAAVPHARVQKLGGARPAEVHRAPGGNQNDVRAIVCEDGNSEHKSNLKQK